MERAQRAFDRIRNDPAVAKRFERFGARLHALNTLGGEPAYALLDRALPGDVQARIVLDRRSPTPILIVLSDPTANEWLLAVADSTLRAADLPPIDVGVSMVIDRVPDGAWVRVGDGERTFVPMAGHYFTSPNHWRRFQSIRRRAGRAARRPLADLGMARVVPARRRMHLPAAMAWALYSPLIVFFAVTAPLWAWRWSPLHVPVNRFRAWRSGRRRRRSIDAWKRASPQWATPEFAGPNIEGEAPTLAIASRPPTSS